MGDSSTRLDSTDAGDLTQDVGFANALLESDNVAASLGSLDGLDADSGSRPSKDEREDGGDGAEESEKLHSE